MPLVIVMWHIPVVVEEPQTCLTVYLDEVVTQTVAALEEIIEFAIAEAYKGVVANGTPVVYPPDIGPHTGT